MNNYFSDKSLLTALVGTNKSCNDDYSVFKEDSHNYMASWIDSGSNSSSFQSTLSKDIIAAFNFTKSKYLNDSIYAGIAANYLAGGYVYKMSGSLAKVQSDLASLQQMGWVDQRTRALFFDFTLLTFLQIYRNYLYKP